jgi:hypothetical protein
LSDIHPRYEVEVVATPDGKFTFAVSSEPSNTRPMKVAIAKDQREALGMLAASLHGRTKSVMEAHGVTIATLRGLVQAGLATADRRPVYFNPGTIVTVLQITAAGQKAIAD